MKPFLVSTTRWKRPTTLLESMAAMVVALLLLPSTLHGQSVDYGALEQLFKEPVTTSVDGSPERVSDVPATMEIITAEDIRRSGAKDIPGVLRHVGGVDTLEWGNDNIDVGVRGYDQAVSARLLVLVDGRQVYTDDYGYTPWSSVPVELGMIRQIEIIKGPNSALFGFNAAGGVINIITYNPLYDKVNVVSATAGTQTLSAVSGVATHQFGGRAAVRFSAGLNSDNDFTTPIPAPEATASRLHQFAYAANLNGVLRLNEKTQLSVEATYSASNLNEMQPSYSIANAIHQTWSWKSLFTKESRWGLLQASGYFNWSRDTIRSEIGAGPLKLSLDDRLAVAQLQDIFKVGAHHTFRAATEYRYTTEDTTTVTGGDVYDSVVAVSGMWNWEISPSLTLTNALRLDRLALGRSGSLPPDYPFTDADWKRSFTPLSFNSGLVWKMSADTLRVIVSRGVELPSLVDSGALTLNLPGGYNTTGSPFLQPTVVTNYEIGWDHVMAGPHLLFRASAFHQKSDDVRAIVGGLIVGPSGAAYFLPANIGSSTANGLELGLRGTLLQNYRWRVDYRPEWIADHFIPSAQRGADFTDYQHTTPGHLVKANLGWANERWEIDSYLHYQSGTFGIQQTGIVAGLTPVPDFVSMDARAAYKFRNWVTWSVSGQNLTHASQLQTVGPAVERRVLGTMSLHF